MTGARTAAVSLLGAVLIHAAAAGVAVGVISLFPHNPAPVEAGAVPSAELMVKLGEAVAAEEPLEAHSETATEPEDANSTNDAAPAETPMEPAPATPTEQSPALPLAADAAPPRPGEGINIPAEPVPAPDAKPVPVPTKPVVPDKPKLAAKPREKPAAPKTASTSAPRAPTTTTARKTATSGTQGGAAGTSRQPAAQATGGYQNAGTASYIRRGAVTYPAEAKRKRQAGSVRLMLYISAAGSVDRVEVVRSSGFPLLDAAAVRAESRSRLNPARKNGIAVPSRAMTECRFVLDLN